MVVTNIGKDDRFDSDLVHYILENNIVQEQLINEIINTMINKGYMGLNIDFEYIYPEDREEYIKFLNKIKNKISDYGYFLFVSVAPKTSNNQQGILYEAHDYLRVGYIADRVIIMTYEWGYSGGEAAAIAPIYAMKKVLDYAITVIPSNKILLGIPNYGYDWTLPFIEGVLADSISNVEAVDLARGNMQRISYSEKNQAPYFTYIDKESKKHEVWFEDARSIKAKLELVNEYNLKGISYWTLNRPFPENYLVLKSLYNISKY
jgi:spore germination protein